MWQGYGTYIMNQLKAYAVRNGCLNIMTFADNAAIGYFTKQVTTPPSLPPRTTGCLVDSVNSLLCC